MPQQVPAGLKPKILSPITPVSPIDLSISPRPISSPVFQDISSIDGGLSSPASPPMHSSPADRDQERWIHDSRRGSPSRTSTTNLDHDRSESVDGGFFSSPRMPTASDAYSDRPSVRHVASSATTSTASQMSHNNLPLHLAENIPNDKRSQTESKKSNKKRLQMLTRSKSLRAEDELSTNTTPKKISGKKTNGHQPQSSSSYADLASRSVPLTTDKDRSFRDMMKTGLRDRSEDRLAEHDDNKTRMRKEKTETKDKQTQQQRQLQQQRQGHPLSSSLRQNNPSTFFNDFRHTSSNAAMGIGKAGKGLLSKFSRSGSTSEKHATLPAEDYIPSILTLPLIDQTRLTRIAQSYDQCKDKTEFWMPALPWRCIDYLNGKCEEEGLYRVSGGLTKVKEWRKRFDTELDVNLLDEPDLYDASIIASLFKEWIRELPEDVFPKDAQDRVVVQIPREVSETESPVIQILREELQQLPPFNYYLLFAITCHLSLLLSYQTVNKMTLDNLYRCFNQSLKLDGRIFYTLVGDWRQCWTGCLTENDYLKAEYDHLQHPYPQFVRDNDEYAAAAADERAISSSGSSAPTAAGISTPDLQRSATSQTRPSYSTEDRGEVPLSPRRRPQRSSSDLTGGMSRMTTLDTTPRGSP